MRISAPLPEDSTSLRICAQSVSAGGVSKSGLDSSRARMSRPSAEELPGDQIPRHPEAALFPGWRGASHPFTQSTLSKETAATLASGGS